MNTARTGERTVPCPCGRGMVMHGTRRCGECWELERRVLARPDLARAMLAELGPIGRDTVLKEALIATGPAMSICPATATAGMRRRRGRDRRERSPGNVRKKR